MSENYKMLDAVQQEIMDLTKQQIRLKNKERKGKLSDDEELQLEEIVGALLVLEGQEKYWQESQQGKYTRRNIKDIWQG
jgi:hypothetical protein